MMKRHHFNWVTLGTLFLIVAFLANVRVHGQIVETAIGRQVEASAVKKPLKVFILVGQSNMQGHAHLRTFSEMKKDSKTSKIYDEMIDGEGNPKKIPNVWITYLSKGGERSGQLTAGFGADENKIGPELGFGIYAQKHFGGPILIIKTAWGGKSLNTDFRTPGSGPYEFSDDQLESIKRQGKMTVATAKTLKDKATGHYYRLTLEHVKKTLGDIKKVYPDYDAEQGYELAGIVWFQGWNDMVDRGTYPNRGQPNGYALYGKLMSQFIRDIRKDLSSPELPFVIGVLGVGGPVKKYLDNQKRYTKIHQNFRDAMAAPTLEKEFAGNVAAVLTENYWDMELRDLRARDNKIKQKVNGLIKEGTLKRNEQKSKLEEFRAETFTKAELESLKNGASNFEFHYLGSAKIMSQIGKGFADAMFELSKEKK